MCLWLPITTTPYLSKDNAVSGIIHTKCEKAILYCSHNFTTTGVKCEERNLLHIIASSYSENRERQSSYRQKYKVNYRKYIKLSFVPLCRRTLHNLTILGKVLVIRGEEVWRTRFFSHSKNKHTRAKIFQDTNQESGQETI